MAVEGCIGYTRGCRCPKCTRHRRRREDRLAQAEQQAVDERAERRTQLRDELTSTRPGSSESGRVAQSLNYRRELEQERSRVLQMQGQISALRQMAVQHSPGAESTELALLQMRQLHELLEQHRDQLRELLNGNAADDLPPTTDG
ncbi:hypothetical protein FZI91_09920 [Mycobacterium sp. CBMA271]|uniref:hypothetical protein n=1 Tax=unclassified Mycobacteroides TaxID=2618759 RepID=UPI0012DE2AED|nr:MULTISPECIES: hypothetical protein [unclassified Mycobacteroides]MUM16672.1 hypothetical protein [Mycobacteroides sp. CBMA 326]MUM22018.1 hypothetical protein [Mycobacteroides sp. CBMA 271]